MKQPKSNHKRLFLFAGYDAQNCVHDALVYYVRTLAALGDVVVYMDCDCPKHEINKLKPYTITTIAQRHGEYDFGSYKRAYIYARDNMDLSEYEFIYLVNDSVFGPMVDIMPTLVRMEQSACDACSIVVSTHQTHAYMESWFVRINQKIALSPWFDKFMTSITSQPTKAQITIKYEHGLSKLINTHDCTWTGLVRYRGRKTYNSPLALFRAGCPFVKKASFIRHYGAAGAQVNAILTQCAPGARDAVVKSANKIYGTAYMDWFLTSNPIKIGIRNIKYLLYKIFGNGGAK